jgi:hypothetical protein
VRIDHIEILTRPHQARPAAGEVLFRLVPQLLQQRVESAEILLKDAVDSWIGGGSVRIVVLPIREPVTLGLRAVLTAADPLLAVILTALVVWGALQVWVLRWFQRLQARVEAGAPSTTTVLDGAPPEFRALGEAFDRTMQSARERQAALAQAAEGNRARTRDLHHHVKNNLLVLISLLSRRQKRAKSVADEIQERGRESLRRHDDARPGRYAGGVQDPGADDAAEAARASRTRQRAAIGREPDLSLARMPGAEPDGPAPRPAWAAQ